eukprot:gene1178-1291_t
MIRDDDDAVSRGGQDRQSSANEEELRSVPLGDFSRTLRLFFRALLVFNLTNSGKSLDHSMVSDVPHVGNAGTSRVCVE